MGIEFNCCQMEVHLQPQPFYSNDQTNKNIRVGVRKGQPTPKIAIKINDYIFQSKNTVDQYQTYISKLQQLDRTYNKPLSIHIGRIPQNQLPQPYYIPQLKCFYLGEWIYNEQIDDNVPGGLGRMYQSEWISQGYFQTHIPQQYLANNNQTQQQQLMEDNQYMGVITLRFHKKVKQQDKNISLYLNGVGRKFNKNQIYQGQFIKGNLHGKGNIKIKQPLYSYVGQWKNNKKHGRGVQQTQLAYYDGQFLQDVKTGQGIIIYHSYKKLQTTNSEDYQDFNKKLYSEKIQMKEKIELEIRQKLKRQQIVSSILKQYTWKNPFEAESIFQNSQFIIQRKFRKKYTQKYFGQFKNNHFHGKGIYIWTNGRTYNGDWNQGVIQGVGQFYWNNGVIYRGQYKNDQKHGKGEIIWCETKRFRGSWAYGIRHGYGQLIIINNNVLTIRGSLWVQNYQQKLFFQHSFQVKGFQTFTYQKQLSNQIQSQQRTLLKLQTLNTNTIQKQQQQV